MGLQKRMEALTVALLLFACAFSPSRGAVANLVLLQDAVKEVSFVLALKLGSASISLRFNTTYRERSVWTAPRLATTSGLVSTKQLLYFRSHGIVPYSCSPCRLWQWR